MNSSNGGITTGVLYIWYMTCLNDGRSFGKFASQTFINNGIKLQNEEFFNKCRSQCDSLMLEYKDYATTEEEIQRFITNTPEKGYKMSETLYDDMKKRGNIVY